MSKLFIGLLFVAILVLAIYFMSRPHQDDTYKTPMLQKVRSNFSQISPSYSYIPLTSGGSSYTDNKSTITLCLNDPKTDQPYDDNTIMYVALHELAHIISDKEGHGDEFKENFGKLLNEGAKRGFYDPSKPIPSNYCGL